MNLTTVNTISHDWSLSGPSWLFYSLLNHHSLRWTGLWPAVQIFQFPLIFMIIGRVIFFLPFPILTHDVFSCSGKMATMATFQCQNQTNAVLMTCILHSRTQLYTLHFISDIFWLKVSYLKQVWRASLRLCVTGQLSALIAADAIQLVLKSVEV